MAIEIPALAPDRLPHPEWPAAAAAGRYVLPAVRVLAVLDGLALPAPLLDGLGRQAADGAPVNLLLSADRALVQVVLDGRRYPLAGAARDAVLTLLGQAAQAPTPAPAGAATRVDAALAARVAVVDAQVQEARAHAGAPLASIEDAPAAAPALASAVPALSGSAFATAAAVAAGVESSGLFLEAHVAQWLRGERSLAQLQDEITQMPATLRLDGTGEQRAQWQLEALQRQIISLRLPAWPGQPLALEIGRDPEHRRDAAGSDAAAPGVFQATLRLDLPRLGSLEVRLRLLQETVGVRILSSNGAAVAPALPQLAGALAGRGLHLAAIDLAPAPAGTAVTEDA